MKTSAALVADLVAGGLDRTPLTTSDGVMFVYLGDADNADVVVMEDRFPPVGPMQRLGSDDVWFAETALDPDGSIEYKLAITKGGKRRLVLDPQNPEHSSAPFGSNSVATGPGYREPAWLGKHAPSGTIRPFPVESKIWARSKSHQLYLPPRHRDGDRVPLLIMHDGPEYVRYAGLADCLDSLISNQRIPPLAALLHEPHARNVEYVDNPLHSAHLFDEVLPQLQSENDLGPIYAGGASLGAVASLTTAFRNSGSIEGLLLQSGSFVSALGGPFKRGPVLKPVTRSLPEVLQNLDRLPDRLVLSCGNYDGLVEDHRALVPRLAESVAHVSYQEINAGHHWRCWRDRLEPDLLTLFQTA